MDALASAACFNTVRRVILDLAIVFLPVTCLNGDATIYTITGAPHSGAPVAVHRLKASPPKVPSGRSSHRPQSPAIRASGSPIARCSQKNPAAAVRPRAGDGVAGFATPL